MVWGRIASQGTARAVVRGCVFLGALVPIIALLTASLGPGLYSIVFFLLGFLISGRRIGFDPYLLSLAPIGDRTTYLGISGTLSIFLIIAPLLGGAIIQFLGYRAVYFAVTAVMLYSFFLVREGR